MFLNTTLFRNKFLNISPLLKIFLIDLMSSSPHEQCTANEREMEVGEVYKPHTVLDMITKIVFPHHMPQQNVGRAYFLDLPL